jgi:hypothetical protein
VRLNECARPARQVPALALALVVLTDYSFEIERGIETV